MMRALATKMTPVLSDFAQSTKHPTRSVENAFAWILIVWSYSVLSQNQMISARTPGNVYGPMLEIMSAGTWGWLGMIIGGTRVVALFFNGYWRPTPELRLAGAAWGLMFWTALSLCYHIAVDLNGGPDFPMRRAFLVLMFYEAYSCYRCGLDIGKRPKKTHSSEPSRSMGAGYG